MSAASPVGDAAAVVDVDVAVDVGDAVRADRVAQPGERARDERAAAAEQQRPPPAAIASATAARTAVVVASTPSIPITPVSGSRASPRIATSRSPRSVAPSRSTMPCSRSAAGASSVPPERPTESIGTPMTAHDTAG